MALLILLTVVGLASSLPTSVAALAARLLGVGVPAITLGLGRPRLQWQLGDTRISVTPWLITSSCTLKEHENLERYGEHPGLSFGELHPLLRAAVVAAGPLVVLGLCVLVGGTGVVSAFLQGFGQIIEGAISPLTQAQSFLARYWQAAAGARIATGAALLAKLMAFQLLPLPLLAGGSALMQLARWKRPHEPAESTALPMVGLWLVLALMVSWTIALAVFLLAGAP
ncbi:site-2 protease family protein [Arenimonas alkanexedens]